MKTRIKWKDGMSFLGESGSGHAVLMDGPPEAGISGRVRWKCC
jgi:putative redox protein